MDSIGEIVNLTAVPYGNAQIDTTTQTVTCQHGDAECSANVYEQCYLVVKICNANDLQATDDTSQQPGGLSNQMQHEMEAAASVAQGCQLIRKQVEDAFVESPLREVW